VTKTKTFAILAVTAVITAACGGSNNGQSASSTAPSTVGPSDMSNNQAPPSRLVIDVNIKGGDVTPTNAQYQAGVKEQIVIRVNSDAEDELHVHSTPDHSFKVEAKPMQSFQFAVDVPGKVDVELHHLNKTVATIAVQ
jgi:ABC-type glycerol-3-phosphate transport system substrate-binding protein